MSRYWNPDWAQPTFVFTGSVDAERLKKDGLALKAQMPKELQVEPALPDVKGLVRCAICGPDYCVLVPGALRHEAAFHQEQIGRLTWYFICTRPRVRFKPDECYLQDDGHVHVGFVVSLDGGGEQEFMAVSPRPAFATAIEVSPGRDSLLQTTPDGDVRAANASMLAQYLIAPDPYMPSPLDLEVRYIGQAKGRMAERCALDRLDEHKKFLAIMEETVSYPYENREVVLMLAAGTTFHISSYDDHKPSPKELETEREEIKRVRRRLDEKVRVDAVEALLINVYKPKHNDHYTGELNPKWDALYNCKKAGLDMLTLTLSTDTLRCGLYTEYLQPPRQHFLREVVL